MPITLQCPRLNCRTILQVPESVRGKRVRCGECGMTFIVPTTAKTAATPKTAPPKKAPAEQTKE